MAKEVLELEIKGNVKTVTKETKDWGKTLDNVNESLKVQNKVITDLEKDLINLKAKQDAIPKGAWVKGMDKLNDQIKKTSTELKLEKLALKDLTNQQKEANTEVKKFKETQKENNKESKETIANFQFMGVSLKGIKKGFSQVIPTAKAMFGTIKAGMISTGIAAVVLAVIALMQAFKRSEEGQEKFQRIMAGIGAVTSQVLDLFADLGEGIINTFKNPMESLTNFGKSIGKFLKNPIKTTTELFVKATTAVTTFVDETKKEVDALVEVTNMRQKAHHIEREITVERAKANREINDLRLKAEDREKYNATQRIALLREAQAIEEDITAKEIKAKKLLVDALKLEQAQGKNNIETKDELARLQAELINLDTKKLRSQRLLQTQITTALNEEKALKKQKEKDDQATADAEFDAMIAANDKWNQEQLKQADREIEIAKIVADAKKKIRDAEIDNIAKGIGLVKSLAGENKALQGASIVAENAVGIAKTIINTNAANSAAIAKYALIPGGQALSAAEITANKISAGISIAASVAATAKGLAALGQGGGGGGGGSIAGGAGGRGEQTPAPQMMSGAFELSGGQAPEAMRAYVVTDEMTNSQNQLANIRRRATI